MSRQTELIDDIQKEKKTIMELTQELQKRYRILGGHFVSAKFLVEPDKWQEWLSASCDINHESADFIMAGEAHPPDINTIFLPNNHTHLIGMSAKGGSEATKTNRKQKRSTKARK